MSNKGLCKWQKAIIQKLDKQTERDILWIQIPKDDPCNTNKLEEWIHKNRKSYMISYGPFARYGDKWEEQTYISFNYVRQNKQERVNYEAINIFKTGRILTQKYYGTIKETEEPPKIIIFSTKKPNVERLPKWKCTHIELTVDKKHKVSQTVNSYLGEYAKVVLANNN